MPRISQLPSLTTADNTDEIAIVDVSASTTKKITRGDLLKAPLPTKSVTLPAINGGATAGVLTTDASGNVTVQGAWESWTPTWTNVSGGTVTYAKYTQIGKTVHFRLLYTLGGANVSGSIIFSLPVAANAEYASAIDIEQIGSAVLRDTGTALYHGITTLASATTATIRCTGASGAYTNNISTTSSIPFTWANTDTFSAAGTYEAA